MKKTYLKPTINITQLQHKTQLLQASRTSTNLASEDDLIIDDDEPAGTGFWGR